MNTQKRAEPVLPECDGESDAGRRGWFRPSAELHLLRSWTGITGITSDQMPLLGEVPEAPGFYVAAGGAAFTHGPTYARLISELILDGRPSSAIDLYSPARFSHVNNFMASV